MKYTQEQIGKMRAIIIEIALKREELEELKSEVNEITGSTIETYSLSFYYSREERVFKIPSLSLIDLYNAKITNLKLEIESLEKRLQELLK